MVNRLYLQYNYDSSNLSFSKKNISWQRLLDMKKIFDYEDLKIIKLRA